MAQITVRHERDKHYYVGIRNHGIVVDQPFEAGGDDLGPTPTELFVAGLAACAGFYARNFMVRHGIGTDGFRVDCDYEMSMERPSRVTAVRLELIMPPAFPETRRQALLRVVEHCTVHNSIRNAPTVTVAVREARQTARREAS